MSADLITEKPDPQSENVHISERFRLARRNALIWSSVTILAALASDACREAISLGFGATGFSHNPNLVVLLALTVMGFMLLGFFRAQREIGARNSIFAHGKSVAEIADKARERAKALGLANTATHETAKLCGQIEREKSKELTQIHYLFEMYSNDIVTYCQELDKAHHHKVSYSKDKLRAEEALSRVGDGDSASEASERAHHSADINRSRREEDKAERLIEHYTGEIKERIEDQKKLIDQVKTTFSNPFEGREMPPSKMDPEWAVFAAEIGTLSNSIGNTERFWLTWFDVRAVWMLAGAAAVVAALKLFYPAATTSVLEYWGLAVTAASCPA